MSRITTPPTALGTALSDALTFDVTGYITQRPSESNHPRRDFFVDCRR
jgi:hypothetical protein